MKAVEIAAIRMLWLLCALSGALHAGTTGYELSVGPGGGGTNTPRFVIANRSDTLEITRFVFTVGDTSRNFDIATLPPASPGVRSTIVRPDAVDNEVRSDSLEVLFTGLSPGRTASIATDLDADTGDSTEDFTKVFFNNGELPNSVIRVEFSDGSFLSQTLPDGAAPGNVYVLSQSAPQFTQSYTIDTFAGGAMPDNIPATSANLRGGRAVAADSRGNVFFAAGNAVFRIDLRGILTRVAGVGVPGFSGDGGPATSALFGDTPQGLAVDSAGNLYVSDNHRIRKIANGVITTIAGNGRVGFGGDNGPALNAQFSGISPKGLALDPAGNIYIADSNNNRIRKISGGIITTIAGTGRRGSAGDNGPAVNAELNYPQAVAVDSAGNVYIADSGNGLVRKISAGVITTVAGGGRASGDGIAATSVAPLQFLNSVAADSAGNLYISANSIYRISNGVITRVSAPAGALGVAVGVNGAVYFFGIGRVWKLDSSGQTAIAGGGSNLGDGGPATRADLWGPADVALDHAGALYIADRAHHSIRRVSNGVVTTIAGKGTHGFSGDNGPATSAEFGFPMGVAVDSDGSVYVRDNFRIRKFTPGSVIRTVAGNGTARCTEGNGPATASGLRVGGLALDSLGTLYFSDCKWIRKLSGGSIVTVAGNDAGASEALQGPAGVAVDAAGDLYIADPEDHRVRKVSNGAITTIAGTGKPGSSGDGGPATLAQLEYPRSIAVDSDGAIYIGQAGPDVITTFALDAIGVPRPNGRVRKIHHGVITTIAGSDTAGFSGDGGPATLAQLEFPWGFAIAPDGTVYVADVGNDRIRILKPSGPACAASATPATLSADAEGGTVNIEVQTSGSCPWAIQSLPAWMSYPGEAVGIGSATIAIAVEPNPGPARSAIVSAAGADITVTQPAGAP